jgi:hypothetical protein
LILYEHDPEAPFQKILVKKDSAVIGVIRRNLKTGDYNYYDEEHGALSCLLQEKGIDRIKLRIDELFYPYEIIPNSLDSGLAHAMPLDKNADTPVHVPVVVESDIPLRGISGISLRSMVVGTFQKIWHTVLSTAGTLTDSLSAVKRLSTTPR